MFHSPLVTTPLLAFVMTTLLLSAAVRIFPEWNLLDYPHRYALSRTRLPYPTGIIAVLVFLILFPFLQAFDAHVLGLMVAVILLAIVSFIDDRVPLPAWFRLFVQILSACIIFFSGNCLGSRICSVTNPLEAFFGGPIIELNGTWPIVSFMVTVFWLLLTTNALNWFDGIPGQMHTLSCIAFLTIGFLSLSSRVDQPALAIVAFVLAAIAAGSLIFDFPPPRVVPGDTGAMFFGLMLGALTIFSGGKVATAFLVLGIPIVDLLFVTVRRVLSGTSPFRGSMHSEHLHHRLLTRGWKPWMIIALTASVGSLFGITALFMGTVQKFIAALLLFTLMLILSLWAGSKRTE